METSAVPHPSKNTSASQSLSSTEDRSPEQQQQQASAAPPPETAPQEQILAEQPVHIQHLRKSLKPWRAKTRLSRHSTFNSLFPIHHPWPHVLFWVQLMVIEGLE